MKVLNYIKENWDRLPKSTFNGCEVVIFHCVKEEDWGYGHHSYEGYGGDKDGNFLWCYSSGCSCNGDAYAETKDTKLFLVDEPTFTEPDLELLDWNNFVVSYNDY